MSLCVTGAACCWSSHLNSNDDIAYIVRRSANLLQCTITGDAAIAVANRCRGVPRIANRLLRRVRDYAQLHTANAIDITEVEAAMDMMGIDGMGLDATDRNILSLLLDYYAGRPVGLKALATTANIDISTLEEVVEPYLRRIGFIEGTAQGRVATGLAADWLILQRKQ